MAVYTKISKKDLLLLLSNYNVGKLENFEGILEGIENTNYKIITSKNTYILTIFEKRVNNNDLPFFISLQNHLHNKNIKCPKPIEDLEKKYINKINNKTCILSSFLKGKKIERIEPNHCFQLGKEMANMHLKTSNCHLHRLNNLSQPYWQKIFDKCKKSKNEQHKTIYKKIEEELFFLQNNWPNDIPQGVIHADLFPDNVFFIDNILFGIIDFYFSCNDFYAYELAICINSWCFDNNIFNHTKFKSLIRGYMSKRSLNNQEMKVLPILLRGSAMRFFLTRLYDQLFYNKNAFVKPRDPIEYFNILEFHKNNSII